MADFRLEDRRREVVEAVELAVEVQYSYAYSAHAEGRRTQEIAFVAVAADPA
jgi:hypothetical protein